jgi:hypothetical protein
MSQPEIKQASSKDIPNIIDTVALAFAANPLVRWKYPDPNQYLSHIHKMAILFAGKAFDHGTVHYVEGYRGLHCGCHPTYILTKTPSSRT